MSVLEACVVYGHRLQSYLFTSIKFWYSFKGRHYYFKATHPKESILLSKLVRKAGTCWQAQVGVA